MPGARSETPEKDLNQTLLAWSQKGLFTHAFAAAGDLTAPLPSVQGLLSPDGRDIFDLASMTKALVTTPAVFNLCQNHEWIMDRPIGDAPLTRRHPERFTGLPEALLALTPRQLLRHESGLPAWRNFYVQCSSGPGDAPFRRPLAQAIASYAMGFKDAFKNGSTTPIKPIYSDVGFLALGILLEASYSSDISAIFMSLCEDPKWLSTASVQLAFGADLAQNDRQKKAVPTGFCKVRERDLVGEVYDENAWALGGRCAHAGLFGTGDALVGFIKGLSASPSGRAMLAAQASEIGGPETESLLGWRQGGDPAAKPFGGGKSMGHLGFTGTAFWITPADHPEKPLRYGIVLTNRTVSGRINPAIKDCRRELFQLLWQSV
jgi:CubicO group peptidase (beta-lactamase class C family)